MGFLMFFSVLMAVIIIGIFIWLMITIFQEGPKPQDLTIVDNFMPQHTNNFSQGILLDVDIGNERNGYTFVPKDIDHYGRKKRKNKAPIEAQLIYVDKTHVVSFPRGTFSGERNRIWLLPPNAEDLPEELKSTKFGKYLMSMIDDINNNKTEVEVVRAGADRVREIYNRMGDGEVSDAYLDLLEKAHTNIIKHASKTEDKTTHNPTGRPSV